MSRGLMIFVAILLAVIAVGMLVLGAFPPKPHRAPVEHLINNDRFKTP
jgi:hypothetical protein